MQKVITCLGFESGAEEAVNYYASAFRNSKILTVSRYGSGGRLPEGTLLAVNFQLDGQEFMALNGGPPFAFSIGMSLIARCDSQEEIDYLWDRLSDGGNTGPCGWLTDRFGVSWQIVPTMLGELMGSGDPQRSQRVMNAILQMSKLDIAALHEAAEG